MWVICLYCSIWQVLKGYRKRVYYCLRWWEFILKNKYSMWAGRGNCLINNLVIWFIRALTFWFSGMHSRLHESCSELLGQQFSQLRDLHSVFALHLYFMQWASAWVGLVPVWETTSFSRGPPKKGAKLSTAVLPVSAVLPSSASGQCLTPSYSIRRALESRVTEGEWGWDDTGWSHFPQRSFWMM